MKKTLVLLTFIGLATLSGCAEKDTDPSVTSDGRCTEKYIVAYNTVVNATTLGELKAACDSFYKTHGGRSCKAIQTFSEKTVSGSDLAPRCAKANVAQGTPDSKWPTSSTPYPTPYPVPQPTPVPLPQLPDWPFAKDVDSNGYCTANFLNDYTLVMDAAKDIEKIEMAPELLEKDPTLLNHANVACLVFETLHKSVMCRVATGAPAGETYISSNEPLSRCLRVEKLSALAKQIAAEKAKKEAAEQETQQSRTLDQVADRIELKVLVPYYVAALSNPLNRVYASAGNFIKESSAELASFACTLKRTNATQASPLSETEKLTSTKMTQYKRSETLTVAHLWLAQDSIIVECLKASKEPVLVRDLKNAFKGIFEISVRPEN